MGTEDRELGPFKPAPDMLILAAIERAIRHGTSDAWIVVVGGSATNIQHIWLVETGPVPNKRGWYVSMNSDLGGAARKDFLVVANCERK